ncbi:type IV pilus assembly protein PilX [Thiogranum longum]|uniref:Type IV pilus assembly protein PilX n=1 Tax=Thiogranum longum TaxID=1537524 RepID=A0A4V2PH31_9GAMM|nr:PilX N-terminal domain-containing pilus assembly protein [Thiogranum longum]TCK19146.1 type IV pilus assembly protein PilX [Thiogranum longum]
MKTQNLHSTGSRHSQQGAVLAVALMILLIMTMIGISGMRGTILQERMANNTRDRNQAFQAAESSLRDAEAYVETIVTTGAFDGTAGLFGEAQGEPDFLAATTWTDNAYSVEADNVPGSVNPPRYFIKQSSTITGVQGALNLSGYGDNKGIGDVTTFRITARGIGASQDDDGASTEVVLRSYYGRIF